MKKKDVRSKVNNFNLSLFIVITLSACSSALKPKNAVNDSYLNKSDNSAVTSNDTRDQKQQAESLLDNSMQYLSAYEEEQESDKPTTDLTKQFSTSKMVAITTDELPLEDYLHYVFGELLAVNYILGDKVKSNSQKITLNLQEKISQQKLFTITETLLAERGYIIRFNEGIYYIHDSESQGTKADMVYGYGNKLEDVPNSSLEIMQMIPFDYGVQTQLTLILKSLAKVNVISAAKKNALLVQGKRPEIIKALEFIQLMDQPAYRNREIGLYKATFVSLIDLKLKLGELLEQEGLTVAGENQIDKAISIISLDRTGRLVFFVPNKKILQRINFWLTQIDQPLSGDVLQYFLYSPQFSRATDLGESLKNLISGGTANISSSTSANSQNDQNKQTNKNSSSKSLNASNENMKMVVDQRANALIFHTTGEHYRQLMPLIKQLDVLPKQVLLEVVIAEVTLSDSFQSGVDFTLTNQGVASSQGGFNLGSGAAGLSYALTGAQGNLNITLFQQNDHVEVLSRPSLLVRDGVSATITVGNDIPTIGDTIVDDGVVTSSVVYRKTGVDLTVKPTINARGIIIMEIKQKISNQPSGGDAVEGAPIIFERSIETEVIAGSGQTIILGGLISENTDFSDTQVPFFSSIPLIGHLFNSRNDATVKTELVVLVTPRIIESTDEWDEIKAKFSNKLTELSLK
ncbi:MAG: general secretion pathway protein D [Psychromonas sp.]|jgi:general secretion pathway protein D|uniref:type II secretion system protein GspD n=1 Tax=Psychromonas sp. TaxID=1884585 RepID=UPI0039E489D7